VDLQHVDVGAQARDGGVDGVEDVSGAPRQPVAVRGLVGASRRVGVDRKGRGLLSRQAHPVDHRAGVAADLVDGQLRPVVVDAEVAFAQQDELVARDIVFADGLADNLLAAPVAVDVGLQ